jgi:hypothetical protein
MQTKKDFYKINLECVCFVTEMCNIITVCLRTGLITFFLGRAMTQAVSRRLPISTARVPEQFRSSGICDGQSDTGAGFLLVLWFPLPILTIPATPHSLSIIQGWYNGLVNGRRTKRTYSHPTPQEIKYSFSRSKTGSRKTS